MYDIYAIGVTILNTLNKVQLTNSNKYTSALPIMHHNQNIRLFISLKSRLPSSTLFD